MAAQGRWLQSNNEGKKGITCCQLLTPWMCFIPAPGFLNSTTTQGTGMFHECSLLYFRSWMLLTIACSSPCCPCLLTFASGKGEKRIPQNFLEHSLMVAKSFYWRGMSFWKCTKSKVRNGIRSYCTLQPTCMELLFVDPEKERLPVVHRSSVTLVVPPHTANVKTVCSQYTENSSEVL